MADSDALTPAERKLLEELLQRGVRFMLVGMSAALLQGARGATEHIDLWFEDVTDPRIADAVKAAGGIWVSGTFGMAPPRIGGDALGDRFDVVTHMDGLGKFADEVGNAVLCEVDGLILPVLNLRRILASKKAANRAKDRLAVHLIEDTLAAQEDSDDSEPPAR